MKNDLQIFYNSDKDIQELNAKIEYLKVTIEYLKECMQNITWRHQTIKNTIDWRKFMAGS
jgi:prefoldin subunit 5